MNKVLRIFLIIFGTFYSADTFAGIDQIQASLNTKSIGQDNKESISKYIYYHLPSSFLPEGFRGYGPLYRRNKNNVRELVRFTPMLLPNNDMASNVFKSRISNCKKLQKKGITNFCKLINVGDNTLVALVNRPNGKVKIYFDILQGKVEGIVTLSISPPRNNKTTDISEKFSLDVYPINLAIKWHNSFLLYCKSKGLKTNAKAIPLFSLKNSRTHSLPQKNTPLNIDDQESTTQIQQEKDPCTQTPIDDAWKEYCEAKAYNAKIREEEEADAKAAEQEAKEEEEYQKRVDAWNEEERQSNIEFIKSQEAEREKAREIWEEEDKAFNESIAKEQAERRAKQAEIKKAHDIIDRFGDDYETQRAAHKKVEELAKNADTRKANRIKNAIRKQFYDSKQINLQAEAEYQASKAKELGKKAKYLNTVKDTSLTVNKVLARIDEAIDPLELGNKIVEFQENSYDAIESYSEGGLSKVVDDFVEKKANELSNDWAGVAKESIEKYKQYHSKKGLKLKPNEVYFDKNGKRLTRVNIYQRVYDKKGNEVSFSFGRRVFKKTFDKLNDDYNSIQGSIEHMKNIKKGVMSGDVHAVVNETLEMTEKEDTDTEENAKIDTDKR